MRRIYRAVLVAYTDSAWLAAFTARKMLGFCLTAIKDWHGRHSYLLQATKVNPLAHAKSVTPPSDDFSMVIEKSERSHDNDTEEIDRIGKPHGKEDPVRGLQTQRGSSAPSATSCIRIKSHAARLLKFAHLPNLWGISLTDYTWRSRAVQTWLQATKALSAGS